MRVLAAVDGSTGSVAAARYGAALSSASGGSLTLLHVVEELPPRPRAGEDAIALARSAIAMPGAQIEERIVSGSPADAIRTEGRDGGYDLVTMGSRGVGRGALSRLLVGSVALRVLSNAPPPVLLVPDAIADPSRAPEIRSLLVPTDGSRASLAAAGFAADTADITGASVLLLHCEETFPAEGFAALALTEEDRRQLETGQERVGRLILRATQEPFLRRGHPVDLMETRGTPPEAILQVAREAAVSLIVMGSYGAGESWLKRQRLGSTAEGVLAGAPCPVVVCKQPIA